MIAKMLSGVVKKGAFYMTSIENLKKLLIIADMDDEFE